MDEIILVGDDSIIRTGWKILLGNNFITYSFNEAANGEQFVK
ncbi:MAG: hypothetical protein ABJA37_00235 [Ferruginibacter sp.]